MDGKVKLKVQIVNIMNESVRWHFNSVFDLQINNSKTVCFRFVINGKVISLHKVIRYVKRSRSSFNYFSAKHTPCETSNVILQTYTCISFKKK